MACCSPTCKKVTIFSFCTFFLISSFLLIFFWKNFYNSLIHKQLTLANSDTYQYKYWMETPIDIYFEVYFFNWTNSEKFIDGQIPPKPKFEEVGPYVFTERNFRENVKFNDNFTVSFNTRRMWKFVPEKSNGTLDDTVIMINPIAIAITNVVRVKHYIIRRAIHYFMKEEKVKMAMKNTVNEYLFEGIESKLIEIARKLKLKGFEIPWDKFGLLYERNNSIAYEGNYTMWTGADDNQKTGIVNEWNQNDRSLVYDGECGRIDASTGEVWNPIKDADTLSIFLADVCSKLTLQRDGSHSSNGIEGNLYVSTDRLFDSGQKYKDEACFSPGVQLPSGVRNISACKYKAPAFVSLPHFNLADKSYRDGVDGMYPDEKKHKIYLVMEPNYGLPLEVQAAIQANLRMYQVDAIDMFQNVSDTMVPMVWFRITGGVPDNMAILIKLIIAAPTIGLVLGYVFLVLGVSLFLFGVITQLRQSRRRHSMES